MGVPYTFASATNSIPLSQLDANFNTPVTIGSTTVGLGNTTTTLAGLANVSTTLLVATTANVTTQNVTTSNLTNLTVTNDASISGLTVGKGGGSVSTNTALGASALSSNTTGASNTAIGNLAGTTATTINGLTAIGWGAGQTINNAGTDNYGSSFLGARTGTGVSSGIDNTFIGAYSGRNTTTGSTNVGLGAATLYSNTTASNNTAVGYQAGYSHTTGTASTYIGQAAGYSNQTGGQNTFIGHTAGYSSTAGSNVFIGGGCGYSVTTGVGNTFIGAGVYGTQYPSGYFVTTGSKNTILGNFNGNQNGLDIRTASNYIVLSDGDGNPCGFRATNGSWTFGLGGTGSTSEGTAYLNGAAATNCGSVIVGQINGSTNWYVGSYSAVKGGGSNGSLTCMNTSGGVYLSGTGATSWTSASDERLKENLEPITNAANKVASLRAVIGNYKSDEEKVRKPFLIAQDVQSVLPEAVSTSEIDGTEYLGVSYTEVVPLLVAAIKELKAEIDQLKGK